MGVIRWTDEVTHTTTAGGGAGEVVQTLITLPTSGSGKITHLKARLTGGAATDPLFLYRVAGHADGDSQDRALELDPTLATDPTDIDTRLDPPISFQAKDSKATAYLVSDDDTASATAATWEVSLGWEADQVRG